MNWDKQHGFNIQKLELKDDYEGQVEATLIIRKAKAQTQKAILYIHGFVDYFYQNSLADWANSQEINFYALDLRKYGRSLLPHQKPNMARSMSEYFEEIDIAINIIRNKDNNDFLIIMGHSTGGLVSSLYANIHKNDNTIDAIILNSPFFDMNKPTWFKKTLLPLTALVGKSFPNIPSPEGLKEGYAKSLHKDHKGEWDFNTDFKPIRGYKINLGWVAAIYYGQQKLQHGLNIPCPILVMYSSKSVTPGNYHQSMHTADSVLNVADISKYANGIGENVIKIEIPDGIHDLILSKKDVRENVYKEMKKFIDNL